MRIAPARSPLPTVGYEERSFPLPRSTDTSAPELITIDQAPMGRETQAAIEEALADEILDRAGDRFAAPPPSSQDEHDMGADDQPTSSLTADAYEIRTFVVRDGRMTTDSADSARREYVERRLLHRLPALSMKEVARIEVAPGSMPETFVVNIWCRVPQPPC